MEQERMVYPLLPLRGVTVFPYMTAHFDVGREKSLAALNHAMSAEQYIFLSTQKDTAVLDPEHEDIYEVGTIARVKQVLALPGDNIRVLAEGIARAKVISYLQDDPFFMVEVERMDPLEASESMEEEAYRRVLLEMLEEYAHLSPKLSADTMLNLESIEDIGQFADVLASDILHETEDKQRILQEVDPIARMERLMGILRKEIDILRIEKRINQQVKRQVDKSQKEYYLREQMKAIQNELGEKDLAQEVEELRQKAQSMPLSEEAKESVEKGLDRLARMQSGTPEATVARGYIDWILDMPWGKITEDNLDLDAAKTILDEDHYGLENVKERVLEYLAVLKLKRDMKGPILCFVGPPGVGKTSIARSIARAVGRSFCRLSLGGVRDEAEIRGHRRTYVGAIPGSIVNSIKQAGTMNPVFLLDEIDKMGNDYRGDPASAMLEVLDPEQNKAFRDHYLEIALDLSKVMFITTANTVDTIPRPLLDRMEVIQVSSYTEQEKMGIAFAHLLPKQAEENGIGREGIAVEEDAMRTIITCYTAESGVRNLERQLATLCRKAAKEVAQGAERPIVIRQEDLERYLGIKKFRASQTENASQVGVVTGLAWTSIGGTTLNVEVTVMPGNGKLELTGQLGSVMKESAMAGLSYVRAHAREFGLAADFHKNLDIHIHVPEGATPKDGPSAGVTMITAMVSALSQNPVKADLAMTGEITLRGRVLPVGGIKEKVLAAHRQGIKTVILPRENEKDVSEIPENVRKELTFIYAASMDEVLQHALCGESK